MASKSAAPLPPDVLEHARRLPDVLVLLANCSAPDSPSRAELVARLEEVLAQFVPTDADENHRLAAEMLETAASLTGSTSPDTASLALLDTADVSLRRVTVQSEEEFFTEVRLPRGEVLGPRDSSESFSGAVWLRWLPVLAQATGRTEDELFSTGLDGLLHPEGVRVRFEDGSGMELKWAIAVRSPGNRRQVAVFTEHSGHYELELGPHDRLCGPGCLSGAGHAGDAMPGQDEQATGLGRPEPAGPFEWALSLGLAAAAVGLLFWMGWLSRQGAPLAEVCSVGAGSVGCAFGGVAVALKSLRQDNRQEPANAR